MAYSETSLEEGIMEPIEMAFVQPLLEEALNNSYRVCSNHEWFDWNAENEFPCVRFDPRDLWWKKDMPEDATLEEMLWDDFQMWFDDEQRFMEDEHQIEIASDMRFYRILVKLPISGLIADRERYNTEIKEMFSSKEYDKEAFEYNEEVIEFIDEQLIDCAKKFEIFKEWSKDLHKMFDDHVVIQDKDGNFRFVDKEWFQELKDMEPEARWQLWEKIQ